MRILALALLVSVAGCSTIPAQPPAPLNRTVIDEKGLLFAFQTFDTAVTAVEELIKAGVIVPGSPRALALANWIDKGSLALQAASAAQRAGSATDYLTAIGDARVAVSNIAQLVKG